MEIYLTAAGELACAPPGPDAAVADLVAAVLAFAAPRIDCAACRHTCCAGLAVYADNVFAARLAAQAVPDGDRAETTAFLRRILRFDPAVGKWRLPVAADGRCRFLAASGRCLIYEIRPLVCRLHLCVPSGAAFKSLKDRLYHVYHRALAAQLAGVPDPDNPVAGATGYDTAIDAVLAGAVPGG